MVRGKGERNQGAHCTSYATWDGKFNYVIKEQDQRAFWKISVFPLKGARLAY